MYSADKSLKMPQAFFVESTYKMSGDAISETFFISHQSASKIILLPIYIESCIYVKCIFSISKCISICLVSIRHNTLADTWLFAHACVRVCDQDKASIKFESLTRAVQGMKILSESRYAVCRKRPARRFANMSVQQVGTFQENAYLFDGIGSSGNCMCLMTKGFLENLYLFDEKIEAPGKLHVFEQKRSSMNNHIVLLVDEQEKPPKES